MTKVALAAGLAVLVALSACGGGGGGGGGGAPAPGTSLPPGTGSISGTLRVPGAPPGGSATAPSATPQAAPSAPQADFVPGEILLRFKAGVDEGEALAALLARYRGEALVDAGPIYPGGPYLLRTDAYKNEALPKEEARRRTEEVIGRLAAEPTVEYAEPNYLARPAAVPNEAAFAAGLQWPLRLINLPAAWELSTGSPEVIVAVIDSGIRPHPDLDANVLPTGFDFVSDVVNAGDGDGPDPDPTDPGSPTSVFHGTHVAGTVAAVSNNGGGVAGVAWNVKILPIRTQGVSGSGSFEGIINGILYAAGLPNISGRVPPRRADVINMSLGAAETCSQSLQTAITAARQAGVVIVAAAGNSAQQGNPVESPASCAGVIAVGAVDSQARRAPYSGFRGYVFIAAPGGNTRETVLGGVLSTLTVSGRGEPLYALWNGTSMAAPHVAGVVALMRSVNPGLSPADVGAILASTARDRGAPGRDPEFGFGLVDAGAAVARAAGVPPPPVPVPYPVPPLLVFEEIPGPAASDTVVFNTGNAPLAVSQLAVTTDPPGGVWLSAALRNLPGCVNVGTVNCIVRIGADPTGLAPGLYGGGVAVLSTGGGFAIPVFLRVGSPTLPDFGPVTVRLLGFDASSRFTVLAATTTDASRGYRYTFPSLPPGEYLVDAGIDRDGSGFFGDSPGELNGLFPRLGSPGKIEVADGQAVDGVDFRLVEDESILRL